MAARKIQKLMYTLTISLFNQSSGGILLRHQNTCRKWCFSYSVTVYCCVQKRFFITLSGLLKPEPPDPWTVCSEITRRKEASEAQYDKHAKPSLLPLPLGSHIYAKPRPSQRGPPWVYGQVVGNPSTRSYSVDTGDLVLRRNRTQLRPAAPPQNNLQKPPALPIPQPSPLGTPTISSDLSQRRLGQPPATPYQAEF